MNDTILKYLAALQEGKSIYTAPERGITLSQINAKKVSDEQSFEFTSNLVVALTDAEGNKSFTDLCSAIDELDSKGVLSVFKAMYKGAFDDKKSITDTALGRQLEHPIYDEPSSGEFGEEAPPAGADALGTDFMHLGVAEAAGEGPDNKYKIEKYPAKDEPIVTVNGNVHTDFALDGVPGTIYSGHVKFNSDLPVKGDVIRLIGNFINGYDEVIKKNIERCSEAISDMKMSQADEDVSAKQIIDELTTVLTEIEQQAENANMEAEVKLNEAYDYRTKIDEAMNEAEAESASISATKALNSYQKAKLDYINKSAEAKAISVAKDETAANYEKAKAERSQFLAEQEEIKASQQALLDSIEQWDSNEGGDGDGDAGA